MADVLNNNTFLDKFRDTCFICVKHLPKTHKRHKLFNVNSKENSELCGYFLKLYNLDTSMLFIAKYFAQTLSLKLIFDPTIMATQNSSRICVRTVILKITACDPNRVT